jgi:hypothetical protein
VYPVPLAIAATFDVELSFQVATATADEARIVSQMNYKASNGTQTFTLICNGGSIFFFFFFLMFLSLQVQL